MPACADHGPLIFVHDAPESELRSRYPPSFRQIQGRGWINGKAARLISPGSKTCGKRDCGPGHAGIGTALEFVIRRAIQDAGVVRVQQRR